MINKPLKKHKRWIVCFSSIMILFLLGMLTACEENFSEGTTGNNEITSIVISFDGSPIENYSYKLTEKENIEEAMRIYGVLKTYKSPDVNTWFEDVTYEIQTSDGKITTKTFKKIRPVTDVFEKIFDSLEVRKQTEPILITDTSQIKKLELYTSKTGEQIIYEDKDDIDKLMLSLKAYYSSEAFLNKDKSSFASVKLFGADNEYVGDGRIFREDMETQSILAAQGNLDSLRVTPNNIASMILTKDETEIEISDPHIMQIVLDYYHGYHTSESVVSVKYILKETKGTREDWYGSFLKDNVPKEIETLFE